MSGRVLWAGMTNLKILSRNMKEERQKIKERLVNFGICTKMQSEVVTMRRLVDFMMPQKKNTRRWLRISLNHETLMILQILIID